MIFSAISRFKGSPVYRVFFTLVVPFASFISDVRPVFAAKSEPIETEVRKLFVKVPNNAFGKLIKARRYERALSCLPDADIKHDEKVFAEKLFASYSAGKFLVTIDACKEWLQANGSAPAKSVGFVYEFMGTCYRNLRQDEKAADAFSKAIALAPTRNGYYQRASTYERLREDELSLEDWSRGEKSSSPRGGKTLQLLFFEEAAIPILEVQLPKVFQEKGSSIDWQEALTIAHRAQELEERGDFRNASHLYAKAVDKFSHDASLWNALAVCSLTCSKSDRVIMHAFQKALALNESDWRLQSNYSAFFFNKNKRGAKHLLNHVFDLKEITPHQKQRIGWALAVCEMRKRK